SKVDVQHLVPIRDAHLLDVARLRGARVVDEDAEPALVAPEGLRETLRAVDVRQIRLEADAEPFRRYFAGCFFGADGVAAGDIGLHASSREPSRDHSPDPARASRHESDFPANVEESVR